MGFYMYISVIVRWVLMKLVWWVLKLKCLYPYIKIMNMASMQNFEVILDKLNLLLSLF
jgi:hypothetical protein